MADIKIEQVLEFTEKTNDWLAIGESPARECLVISFKKGTGNEPVIDDEMVSKTLYLQSRNGNVAIEFDDTGLIVSIEIS